MAQNSSPFLVIGQVLKPWGYRGEVKVKLVTGFPNRVTRHKRVYLGAEAREMQVEHARLHSRFAVFKFAGFDTPESVAKLRGEVVQIPAQEAAPLRKGQYYHHEIIGLNVITTDGEPVGTVEEILETGANDVYLVRSLEGKEVLLPAIASVVQSIDLAAHTITVSLLPGLIE